jgi:hypothetical protein
MATKAQPEEEEGLVWTLLSIGLFLHDPFGFGLVGGSLIVADHALNSDRGDLTEEQRHQQDREWREADLQAQLEAEAAEIEERRAAVRARLEQLRADIYAGEELSHSPTSSARSPFTADPTRTVRSVRPPEMGIRTQRQA